ncbi:MAG TPA: triose-phosphate isomerase [Gammaproteobacteria bacterium]|nr:triose-phosphate isomerase [Gammaproteobacteria bacterium]
MRKPCVIANWKMQGSSEMISNFVLALAQEKNRPAGNDLEIVLCPPALYLQQLRTILEAYNLQEHFLLGGQNVYCESSGAFTGEIAPEMLLDMGCRYVIIGHSERRQLFQENDTLIARKFRAAYHVGLIPILCVGETEAERVGNKTFEVVARQLEAILALTPISHLSRSIIAYEPIWAIGTGLTATPLEAEVVHGFLRDWLGKRDLEVAKKARIVYGGSVKAENAAGLLSMPNIDGALVGGASLVAEHFLKICSPSPTGQ